MPAAVRERDTLRHALLDAAARIIATEGVAALTLRRVADEAGTSTMGIYTRFGGMPELRHAVRVEGFARLAGALAEVDQTSDPVADVAALGLAYYRNGVDRPHLYRAMFMEQPLGSVEADIGWDTYETLVAATARAVDSGRFSRGEPRDIARQLWVLAHGVVSLELTRILTPDEAFTTFGQSSAALFVSFGDDPRRMRRSLAAALRRSPS
jgi:AcrR family transcriptional regulator